jgi:radical SAM family uncharacterized protein/radical SAM-linked protein
VCHHGFGKPPHVCASNFRAQITNPLGTPTVLALKRSQGNKINREAMPRQSLEGMLPLVQHPSHYLGTECNVQKKDPQTVRLRVCLAFPDLYEVGMSHLGIQILYHILNSRNGIAAERAFAPGRDLEGRMRASGATLCSLETHTPLSNFDIIGFSLLYELNFTNILTMLDLSGQPFYARDRDASHPLIIAGGPCTFNPEPLADFFDAVVIGDGEEVIVELAETWLKWKDTEGEREEILRTWSRLRGVYVPSFFDADIGTQGFQVLTSRFPEYTTVQKAVVSDLNQVSYPDCPVVPFGRPIHDRLSLEICRGCTRGCRFCQAGMIYRPVRERTPEMLLSLAERSLANTGHGDISLLSLSTGDYTAIHMLMQGLMDRCEPEKIAVSLPSLRVGSLTEELMTQIKRVRKTGFTIAPEAGSQRLRQVINKNISEKDLEETVRNAFGLGWQLIKLYFMIGLPTETQTDLEAIIKLVKGLQRGQGRKGPNRRITVSVSTFIPKAHTPFQWCSQMSVEESREKIRMLRNNLRGRHLRFKWQNPEMSQLEGLWARGDRRLSGLLVKAYEMGCRFDGWSDQFEYSRWKEAIEACGVDVNFYTTRSRDLLEPLPWDHIDSGVSKEFLKQEWERALKGQETPDCRRGDCNMCGLCDFEALKPVVVEAREVVHMGREVRRTEDEGPYKKLGVSYAKRGPARHFGHLELVKIFVRALRRARIPLRFSQGFHPAPKIAFECALPVGTESVEEHFTIQVPLHVSRETLLEQVNPQLPEGLTITGCSIVGRTSSRVGPERFCYMVTLKEGKFSENKLEAFLRETEWPFTRKNSKGKFRTVDMRPVVKKLKLLSSVRAEMVLEEGGGCSVRPMDVLRSIFGLSETELKLARVVKSPASTNGRTSAS